MKILWLALLIGLSIGSSTRSLGNSLGIDSVFVLEAVKERKNKEPRVLRYSPVKRPKFRKEIQVVTKNQKSIRSKEVQVLDGRSFMIGSDTLDIDNVYSFRGRFMDEESKNSISSLKASIRAGIFAMMLITLFYTLLGALSLIFCSDCLGGIAVLAGILLPFEAGIFSAFTNRKTVGATGKWKLRIRKVASP